MSFAIEFTLDGSKSRKVTIDGVEYVEREAPLIFKSGHYPDKNFSMSKDELKETISKFSNPVALGLEHIPTILSNRLGKLVELKDAGEDEHGNALMSGLALIPSWLDAIVPAKDRKLSAAFDRTSKSLIGCDFVIKPRVDGAAMMSKHHPFVTEVVVAFSHSPEGKQLTARAKQAVEFAKKMSVKCSQPSEKGQKYLKKLHKTAAMFGATCKMPMKPAEMSDQDWDTFLQIADKTKEATFGSKEERRKIQHIHNLTSEAATFCAGMIINDGNSPGHATMSAVEFAAYSGKTSNMTKYGQDTMKKLHDKAVKFGAKCGHSVGMASTDSEISIEEMGKIQRVHDVSSEDTWHCKIPDTSPKRENADSGPKYKEQRDDDGINDLKNLNDMGKVTSLEPTKDMTEYQVEPADTGSQPSPAQGSPGFPPNPQFSQNPPKRIQRFATEQSQATQQQNTQPQHDERVAALMAENVRLKAANETAAVELIQREAAVFARNEVLECRAFPSEQKGLAEAYIQAASDDRKLNDTVQFSGAAMSRVDALKARHAQRPPHDLTGESMPVTAKDGVKVDAQVLFNDSGPSNGKPSLSRINELMGMTGLGRAIQNANGKH